MKKKLTDESKAHATFSASGANRWLECPGSINLSKGVPESEGGPAAKEGTEAHRILEILIKSRKKRSQVIKNLRESQVASEMIIHAEMTLDYLEARLLKMPGAELLAETRCPLPVSEPGQFGTADAVIIDHFGKLIVVDYKYGYKTISPKDNPQMLYYALAVAHQYDYNFTDVELIIIQPRAQVNGAWVRPWNTTVENLLVWKAIFEVGIRKANHPQAPLVSGDHCQYCPAAFKCPEIRNQNLKQAGIDFDDQTGVVTVPEVGVVALDRVLTVLPKIELWISAVRAHAFQYLQRGGVISGFKLVEKRWTRKWVDARKTGAEAVGLFGKDAFTKPELLSPAQLEKIGAHAKKFVEKHSAMVSSGLTLVSDSDKRQGTSSASADFDDEQNGREESAFPI